MHRRTFIKAVVLTVPSLFMRPLPVLDALGSLKEKEFSPPEFMIFFIGDYGKALSVTFRKLKEYNPVLRRCDHIRMDVNRDDGFINLSNSHVAVGVLSRLSGVKLAVFVVDMAMAEDLAVVNRLAEVLKSKGSRLIALGPGSKRIAENCAFDLVFETQNPHGDRALSFLLTFHNTYLGCGGMGSTMCIKYYLDFFLAVMHFRYGRVVKTIRASLQGEKENLQNKAAKVIIDSLALSQDVSLSQVWAIIEMPFRGVDSFALHDVASTELMRLFPMCLGCLVHPGLKEMAIKTTVVDWNE